MASEVLKEKRPQDWINLVLAACLFLSPWVIGFADETMAAWDAWVAAVLLAAAAVAALSVFAEWEEWLTGALGIWLIVAPWVLDFFDRVDALWTHIVLGVLTVAVSSWAVWESRHGPRLAA